MFNAKCNTIVMKLLATISLKKTPLISFSGGHADRIRGSTPIRPILAEILNFFLGGGIC